MFSWRKRDTQQRAEELDITGAAQSLYHLLLDRATTDRGAHAETLLVALGALAGFTCQSAARHALRAGELRGMATPWAEATGADGRTYHFGDAINFFLLEGEYSFCRMLADEARMLTSDQLPDLNAIVAHVATTVGTGGFGLIRFPGDTGADADPIDYLRTLWPQLASIFAAHSIPSLGQPAVLLLTARRALRDAGDIMPVAHAFHELVESAVFMAKVDPAELNLRVAA